MANYGSKKVVLKITSVQVGDWISAPKMLYIYYADETMASIVISKRLAKRLIDAGFDSEG